MLRIICALVAVPLGLGLGYFCGPRVTDYFRRRKLAWSTRGNFGVGTVADREGLKKTFDHKGGGAGVAQAVEPEDIKKASEAWGRKGWA